MALDEHSIQPEHERNRLLSDRDGSTVRKHGDRDPDLVGRLPVHRPWRPARDLDEPQTGHLEQLPPDPATGRQQCAGSRRDLRQRPVFVLPGPGGVEARLAKRRVETLSNPFGNIL